MIAMTLAEVAMVTGGQLDGGADPHAVVSAPSAVDSRHVRTGGLFVCLGGQPTDAHEKANDAIARGAVAVLATRSTGAAAVIVEDIPAALADLARAVTSRYIGTVVAVTGSAGKTSTRDLLVQILAHYGKVIATPRSFDDEWGFPATILRVDTDTDALVLEMNARSEGHIRHLSQIAHPELGVVLGVSSADLSEYSALHYLAEAKRELVNALTFTGTAILNRDDPLVRSMARTSAARVVWFGTEPDADIRAIDVSIDEHAHACFTLVYENHCAPVCLQIAGAHHLTNALAAAAVALTLGMQFSTVAHVLGSARLLSDSRCPGAPASSCRS